MSKTGELNAWISLKTCEFDGFIIYSDSLSDDQIASLLEAHPNSVFLNRYIPQFKEHEGGAAAIESLIESDEQVSAVFWFCREFFKVRAECYQQMQLSCSGQFVKLLPYRQ